MPQSEVRAHQMIADQRQQSLILVISRSIKGAHYPLTSRSASSKRALISMALTLDIDGTNDLERREPHLECPDRRPNGSHPNVAPFRLNGLEEIFSDKGQLTMKFYFLTCLLTLALASEAAISSPTLDEVNTAFEAKDYSVSLTARDLQSRPAQHGTWRHHPETETCLDNLTSTFGAL